MLAWRGYWPIRETAGVDQWKARGAVAEGIKSQDFPFTAGQLRQWARRGNSAAVRTYADKFLADADEQAFRCFFLPAGKNNAARDRTDFDCRKGSAVSAHRETFLTIGTTARVVCPNGVALMSH